MVKPRSAMITPPGSTRSRKADSLTMLLSDVQIGPSRISQRGGQRRRTSSGATEKYGKNRIKQKWVSAQCPL